MFYHFVKSGIFLSSIPLLSAQHNCSPCQCCSAFFCIQAQQKVNFCWAQESDPFPVIGISLLGSLLHINLTG